MNDDLISRNTLKALVYMRAFPFDSEKEFIKLIDNAPTVDVFTFDDMKKGINVGYKAGRLTEKWERPHGDWIINPDTRTMKCNRCGTVENANRLLVEDMNYCHCCGANMRKGGAE